ncbi:ArdC family protein [Sphingomonas asaccharolytica]|uniref:ArdC family protein n=1 Tax=Sphingomonas asaccharolytica TaxID=40681 RepID=UPI000A019AC3|nr:zincin-like metallopeptidase domain-containing protein [Sphingomonas asaccharolytica]
MPANRRSVRGQSRSATKSTRSIKPTNPTQAIISTAKGGTKAAGARSARTSRRRGEQGDGVAATAPRASLYEEVTQKIIAELEAGRFPWAQPWESGAATAAGLPVNAATGRAYSGVNILILWGAVIARGYPAQRWLTFRQAATLGGMVRRGEHGVTVVYADRFTPEAERARAEAEGSAPGTVPFLKRFTLFNVAQCDGLDPALSLPPAPIDVSQQVPAAERVIAASGVAFRVGGNEAFYSPARDMVVVPPQSAFFDAINYYRTCLHELTHATGHAVRLGRDLSSAFGTPGYAREELIAEMGSAFLCAALGIVPTVRHADYLCCWLDLLCSDARAIVRAASAASRAADWLLARVPAASPVDAPLSEPGA